jgi:hypothetical protein
MQQKQGFSLSRVLATLLFLSVPAMYFLGRPTDSGAVMAWNQQYVGFLTGTGGVIVFVSILGLVFWRSRR